MSLAEAAALFFPAGPIRVSALRTAIRRGELGWVMIAGRIYTTPAAVAVMAGCRTSESPAKQAGSGEDWDAYLGTLLPDRSGGRR